MRLLALHLLVLVLYLLWLVLMQWRPLREQYTPRLSLWCKTQFRALSHLLAGACVPASEARYSFSAECGSRSGRGWRVARWCVDKLFGKEHCRTAALHEKGFAV